MVSEEYQMHNEAKIKDGLFYVGGSDRRLALFENVYPLENGVSYNSYLYLDEKTCLLDTVDASVSKVFYDNLDYLLGDRKLDYLIVNHMEPDHAANIGELLLRHKETTIVVGSMAKEFLLNYFPKIEAKFLIVKEGDTLSIGKHRFHFISAPMVHWPEVMFTYEEVDKILFSADAFGTFGALSGNIFADLGKYEKEHLSEARRYYTNIVGKYGPQVINVLKKAATLDIKTIAPLHGPILEGNLNKIINYYIRWANYTPEENDAVMIAYSSVYGNTKNVADILATKLAKKGIKNLVEYDVSKTDSSYLIAEAFRVHTIVLAATTYNAGVFIKMEDFLHDLEAHKITNRTIAFIENGSWAPAAKANMKRILAPLSNINYLNESLTIASSIHDNQLESLDAIAIAIAKDLPHLETLEIDTKPINRDALFKLTYGLFLVFSKDQSNKDNASINNSFFQISDDPSLFALSVNKANLTATTILETGIFNVSALTEETSYSLIKRFGFQSGREVNKFIGFEKEVERSNNGLYRLTHSTNAYYSLKVKQSIDCGNHILFIAELVEAKILSSDNSLTYAYYFAHTKPTALPSLNTGSKKVGWRCKICGYTYVGEELPKDYICPICKHPASDFEKVEL